MKAKQTFSFIRNRRSKQTTSAFNRVDLRRDVDYGSAQRHPAYRRLELHKVHLFILAFLTSNLTFNRIHVAGTFLQSDTWHTWSVQQAVKDLKRIVLTNLLLNKHKNASQYEVLLQSETDATAEWSNLQRLSWDKSMVKVKRLVDKLNQFYYF